MQDTNNDNADEDSTVELYNASRIRFVLDEAGTDGGDANIIGFPLPLSTL